jgi:hypothetical protein
MYLAAFLMLFVNRHAKAGVGKIGDWGSDVWSVEVPCGVEEGILSTCRTLCGVLPLPSFG